MAEHMEKGQVSFISFGNALENNSVGLHQERGVKTRNAEHSPLWKLILETTGIIFCKNSVKATFSLLNHSVN